MKVLLFYCVFTVVSMAIAVPLLGDSGSGSLFGKVANFKHTVYERKREFLNGINEKVSSLLWIPPLPSTTTAAPAPVEEKSERATWWWSGTTPVPKATTTKAAIQESDDLVLFTFADTDHLQYPNVAMYARSAFIPEEQRLTDSSDANAPVGRTPLTQSEGNTKFLP